MVPEPGLAGMQRLLRFIVAGALAATVQLALLTVLLRAGWGPLPGDTVAFLVGAQVNFALAASLTWRDRWHPAILPRRWLKFHLAIASTAGLNLLTFMLARLLIPTLPAALLGVAVAGAANFLLGDRIVFRQPGPALASVHLSTVWSRLAVVRHRQAP